MIGIILNSLRWFFNSESQIIAGIVSLLTIIFGVLIFSRFMKVSQAAKKFPNYSEIKYTYKDAYKKLKRGDLAP